jgi:uncharacterized protein (TIGR03437 family)
MKATVGRFALALGFLAALGAFEKRAHGQQTHQPLIADVVNSASFAPNLAPGGFVTLTGSDLAPCSEAANTMPLPLEICQTKVVITPDGRLLKLHYVSPEQINAVLPEDLNSGFHDVYVARDGVMSKARTVEIKDHAPGIFVMPCGLAAVQRWPDYQTLTLSAPAKPADVLVFYGTGLGKAEKSEAGLQLLGVPDVYLNGKSVKALGAAKHPRYEGLDVFTVELPGDLATGIANLLACYESGRYCSEVAELPVVKGATVRTFGGRLLQSGKPAKGVQFAVKGPGGSVGSYISSNNGNLLIEVPR